MFILLHTYANRETLAASYLEAHKFETYLPLNSKGKGLYGPYVFVRCDDDFQNLNFTIIKRAHGAKHIVMFGESIARISDELIADFKAADPVELPDELSPGQFARVTSGAFNEPRRMSS